jgi:hypothetical protein
MTIVNITAENDADFIRGFQYASLNPDGSVGAPIDLTGDTLRMGIRHKASDVEQDLLLTTENGGLTITDAVNGKFTLWITNEQLLEKLQTTTYDHSLIRIRASGLQLPVWYGTLTVSPGPSR